MSERRGKLIGLGLNIVYFIVTVVVMFAVNANYPKMPGLDNMVFGAIGLLGAVLLYIAYGMFDLPDYLTSGKKVARTALIVVGIVILAGADLIALLGGIAIENNGSDYGPWYLALGGMWWIAAAIMLLYFKAAQNTKIYQIGCMVVVPVSLALGYVLCGAVCYLPIPWLFSILLGIVIFVIGMLVFKKIGDMPARKSGSYTRGGSSSRSDYSSYSGGSSSYSGGSSSATRKLGSESGLKRAVLDALPSSGSYLGSWGYGDIYLDSIGVDIWVSARRVSISGSIRFVCQTSDGSSVDTIRSNAQDHLDDAAEDLVSRAVSAVEDYMDKYSGLDGDWSVSAKDISASFSA